MLDTFRESKTILGYIFFGAIIVVFALSFGPGSIGMRDDGSVAPGSSGHAAFVNGEMITEGEFALQYANLYQYMRQQAGEEYDAERARQDNLKAVALQRLVDQELLAQTAEQHGLYVSDDELKQVLLSDPSFQQQGMFNGEIYRRYLRYQLGISSEKYEERLRRRILAGKMSDLLQASAVVSDDEVRAEFLAENEKSAIGYVAFTPNMFQAQAEPTKAEIEKFLAEKKEEAQAHYQRTAFMYSEPRQALTRRILVRVEPGGPGSDEAAAQTKINEAQKALGEGKDFAEVARQYSDDPDSKDKGGEIGWVAPGKSAFGRKLEEEVAKLDKGGMSPVFRDRLGFQILRVDDVKPPTQKTFEEVAGDVAREVLREQKARELAQKKAEETLKKIRTAGDLKKLHPPLGGQPTPEQLASPKPAYRESDPFSPSDGSVPGLGAVPAISQLAFALTLDKPVASAPVEERGAFFAVTLVQRTRADAAQLDKEIEKWRDQARRRKQFELFQNLVLSLRAHARVEQNPQVLAYSDEAPAQPQQ